MKSQILCIQISNTLINSKLNLDDIQQRYYHTLYKTKDKNGYYKDKHFWELPQWIAEIDYNIKTDFYICTGVQNTLNYILNGKYKYVCFSVLDVNKEIIKSIIQLLSSTNITFLLGGYVDFKYFINCKRIKVFNTIKKLIDYFSIEYKQGFSYRLFKGCKTIPRLTLSTGCLHNCDFCTIEKQIVKTPTHIIEQQVKAFKPLKFKLVYINDKTFGQCTNYKLLPRIYQAIKEYNKDFEGFIIQTTTFQVLKFTYDFLEKSHIKYIECGIETFNDQILRKYHKANTEKSTIELMRKIRTLRYAYDNNIMLIPNIIIGMPEETDKTYLRTLRLLIENHNIISHLNIYNLAVYANTNLAKRIKPTRKNSNELTLNTSKQAHINFYTSVYQFGIDILTGVY